MHVTIIGPGKMGRGIATRLLSGSHSVVIAGRTHEQAAALARELEPAATEGGGRVTAASSSEEAIPGSDAVILALPYAKGLEFARENGGQLAGKVVVDISNPLNESGDGFVTDCSTSAAETLRALLPADVRLVKAFNTTFAGTLEKGSVADQTLDVFITGDDEEANGIITDLVRTSGMRPLPVGGLERARQLEAVTLLGITAQSVLGTRFMTAWKLLLPGTPSEEAPKGFPTNAVVGVFQGPDTAVIAGALADAGFSETAVDVLYGVDGKQRIAESDKTGRGLLEFWMGFEQEHTRRYTRELDAGNTVVIVRVDDREQGERASEIMAGHGGQFVNRYSRWKATNVVP